MSLTVVEVLAVIAPLVYLVRLLPQPVRLWRTGVAAGVSPLAAMNGVIGDIGWLAYGLSAGLPAVWAVSAVALVPATWTVALLRRRVVRTDLVIAGAWAAVLVVSAGLGVVGITLALGVLITQGPQVWAAIRSRDLRGIAPGTWWLSVLDALTWGSYGAAVGDEALMLYGMVLIVSATIVLGRIHWTRRARSPQVGEGTDPIRVRPSR
jgi:uncharacterized protein with PQ loop repeat